jgi:hypothetical protein
MTKMITLECRMANNPTMASDLIDLGWGLAHACDASVLSRKSAVRLMRCEGCDDFFEAGIAAHRIIPDLGI